VKLCDFELHGGRTCDAKLCARHATTVGPERDFCPPHAKIGQRQGRLL